MGKLNWMTKACGIFLLWAMVAVTLPAQTFTSLFSFDGTNGSFPYAGLVQATNGKLYGTTFYGGANRKEYGTVFSITAGGMLTTLHHFDFTDGENPAGVLVQAANGNLYGTTLYGGANGPYGTVFSITASGMLTTLRSFDRTDGGNPYAGLIQATNGTFYGTTFEGGASVNCAVAGCGTVFSITASGTLTTLHSFDKTDGKNPEARLVQATNGDFYGTTGEGGANGYGTVFKITPSGVLTTLHSFDDTDGSYPTAGLVQASNGDFYGTTGEDGASGEGTVFKITPSGTLTTLHSFDRTDGGNPYAGLIQGTNGMFYGTTYEGGANNNGTVFGLSVDLSPFVKTQPTSGAAGAAVKILGTSLTGAISVTFNGTPATFMVGSASQIKATVPAGATTGTVQVVTPGSTLKSNIPFTVN
jgi:uncharacterized repeat protein (TIGR03803 family)